MATRATVKQANELAQRAMTRAAEALDQVLRVQRMVGEWSGRVRELERSATSCVVDHGNLMVLKEQLDKLASSFDAAHVSAMRAATEVRSLPQDLTERLKKLEYASRERSCDLKDVLERVKVLENVRPASMSNKERRAVLESVKRQVAETASSVLIEIEHILEREP